MRPPALSPGIRGGGAAGRLLAFGLALLTAVGLALATPAAQARASAPTAVDAGAAASGAAPAAGAASADGTAVCVLSCDGVGAAQAQGDSAPVPARRVGAGLLTLHVSAKDDMAWGVLAGGSASDTVWVERTWNAGTDHETLGTTALSGTGGTAATALYNITDPRGHRRGWVRACAATAGRQSCTGWAYPKDCDTLCDGTPSSQAAGDAVPVPEVAVDGRTLALHADQRDRMGWAGLAAARPGDRIWIERSWDGGASTPDGGQLGLTAARAGASTAATSMFASRDPRGLLYGGALRACLRPAGQSAASCTEWSRPAPSKAAAAADALMWSYDPYSGWWPSSWWNSAATLTALIDYERTAGTHDYDWVVARTFDENHQAFPAGVRSSDAIQGNFISRAVDDTGWWGLAWLTAYDYTHQARYLATTQTIGDFLNQYWDPGTCGGGEWWSIEKTYKNAVTSGLYLLFTAELHQAIPGDTQWLDRARTAGAWYMSSGLIDSQGLVNDGLTDTCQNNGQTVWSYNQGLAIGGLTELWKDTGDATALATARRLADTAMSSGQLTVNGILTESCDLGQGSCDDNQRQFKGIFIRNFADLARATGAPAYRDYIRTQADSIWSTDRDSLNNLGERWAGTTPNATSWRTQASALEALTAAAAG
ncbi:glycoside hydrolase family 76 protein [Phaeacidiphilus oryzae]|uniref:glycoside hydrolase family 76 protein n=1 Tax=Phaeacidiphilus oryzae TaxID=348818 RepID=UPI000AEDC03D|nr:glycoside hydrolase family 76 protein [Phaeacidiphilus oryzae]